MGHAEFPWRHLGALLVDDGLLTPDQLELALAEQQKSGRLLGEILVDWSHVTGLALARALAKQHGVELKPTDGDPASDAPSAGATALRGWRPLGKVLVDGGYVAERELEHALAAQRKSGRRLGEILVENDYLSGPALAAALAEQHGVEITGGNGFGDAFQTTVTPTASGQAVYQVCAATFEPRYQAGAPLYESANFLEAADFAFEFVEDHAPAGLEIQRIAGGARETVWMYSERRAAAVAESRKSLTETFGFDPTSWNAGRRFNP
jgi:hypothetical protein